MDMRVARRKKQEHDRLRSGKQQMEEQCYNVPLFTKPDVASDHNLVMAGIRVKLKTVHREKSGKEFDIERLDYNLVRREYSTLLKNKWEQTKKKNRDSVEETWEDIRSIYRGGTTG